MKKILLALLLILCAQQASRAQQQIVDIQDITRILNTLAADDMKGRSAMKPEEIGKAADFISSEFKAIGLTPYAEDNFRQTFFLDKISTGTQKVSIEGKVVSEENFLVYGKSEKIEWNQNTGIKVNTITEEDDFSTKFRAISRSNEGDEIIWIHPSHASMVARFKKIMGGESLTTPIPNAKPAPTKVFILSENAPQTFNILATTNKSQLPLFNVIGMLPGKSKADEFVIFSAHYDHIGILNPIEQDSIANGADDDASGTTAVIALAKYYKSLGQNERTLLFVAFTAEEIGMYGSKYFSNNINPDKVVAMVNIEMIGKDAKFGPNSMYMTGFTASNLGQLMQENLKGTAFKFHPDPYPQQNLFYRSDNATLAALGVPAHTLSTVQIENDTFYHTVKDEVSTLDINNIKSSIEAIAKGATSIVNGTQTPTRVEKLRQ